MKKNNIVIWIFVILQSLNIKALETDVFSTWEGFEVDKCASIWLIKRYIDENARIKFFPRGSVINEGIPFDVPDSKFRRYHNMSTFEYMLKDFEIKDPKLIYIGRIIHDIEINIWERKVLDETPQVQERITRIIKQSKSNDEVIRKSCNYFDFLFKNINLKVDRKICTAEK